MIIPVYITICYKVLEFFLMKEQLNCSFIKLCFLYMFFNHDFDDIFATFSLYTSIKRPTASNISFAKISG